MYVDCIMCGRTHNNEGDSWNFMYNECQDCVTSFREEDPFGAAEYEASEGDDEMLQRIFGLILN